MAKQVGQFFDLYLAATSPALPTTVANYTVAGEVTDVKITQARGVIEAANWDSGYDDDVLVGRRSRTLTCTAHLDITPDAGQAIALNAFEAVSGQIWWLMFPSSGVTGDIGRHGVGVIVKADEGYPLDGVITLEYEIRITTLTRFTRA